MNSACQHKRTLQKARFIMEELIRMISQRTGIQEEQAREAVQMVLNHIKAMLPQPFADQLDRLTARSVGLAPAEGVTGQPGEAGETVEQPAEAPAESGLSGMIGKIFRG
jgi:hypothetical protein